MKREWMVKMVLTMVLGGCTTLWGQGSSGTAPGQQRRQPPGLLVFDLTPNLISPSTITVTEGEYLVRVRNGITSAELAVVLDHENLPKVMESSVKAHRGGDEKTLTLRPGKHTLRVGGKAGWTAVVVVLAAETK